MIIKKDFDALFKCKNCTGYLDHCFKEGLSNDNTDSCHEFFPIKAVFFDETEKGKPIFVPLKLAAYIGYIDRYVTLKDTGETFNFNDGVYHANAEIKIKEKYRRYLTIV